MAEIIVTPQAQRDIAQAISALHLPPDTWVRIDRSLRALETFPQAGRALGGRWSGAYFVLGPWRWMVLPYRYEESTDRVFIVAMHDGRSSTSATAEQM